MQINFNPALYEYYTGAQLLDAGDYPVVVTEDAAERTNDQTGGLLKVVFTVMPNHPNAGRKLFNRFNLWNQSVASCEVAHKQYKTMLAAMGITEQVGDTTQTYNRPLMVTVSNDGKYNNVVAFKTIQGVTPGKEGTAGALTPQQPQQGFGGGQPQGGFNPGQMQQPPPQQQFQPQPPQQGAPLQFPAPGQPQQVQPSQGFTPQGGGFPAPGQAAPGTAAPWNGPTGAPPQQPQQPAPGQFQPQGGQFAQPQFTPPQNPGAGFQQQQPGQAPQGW